MAKKQWFGVGLNPAVKLGVCASLLLTSPLSASATTLDEALGKAYLNNPALIAARDTLKATNETVAQANAGWLPSVTGNFNRTKSDTAYRHGPNIDSTGNTKQLNVTQPVFNGFQTIAQMHRADNLVKAGVANLDDQEESTLASAVTAYMDVVQGREVLALNKNNEHVLVEQLKATVERFKLGENTKTDVAQSQSRKERAISDRVQAEAKLTAAEAAYQRVIGESAVTVEAPKNLPKIPAQLDQIITRAIDSNPALKRAEYTAKAAENDVSIAKSRLLPTVSLQGQVQQVDGQTGNAFGRESDSKSVTLAASVPLFQSGSEYSQIRQFQRTYERRQHEADDQRNITVQTATTAWKDLQTTRASIHSNHEAVKAAKTALEGVRQEAEVGARTTLDILDAEQELFITQIDLSTSKRNEVVAIYNVKAAMGDMTAARLGLKVPLYDSNAYLQHVKYKMIGY